MELTQLRYFVLVAENGSTARAAAAAMVSQSTISKALLRLEQELGLPLFDRESNRLVLNPAGQEFLQQVRPILTAVNKLPGFVKQRHQPRQQYRINVSAAQPAMAGFVHRFLRQEPAAQLILTEESWIDDCDLSIASGPSGRQEDSVRLLEERLLLAVPRRLLSGQTAISPAMLEGLPLILPGENTALRGLLDRQLLTLPAVVELQAVVSDCSTLRQMVQAGDGAAFWPELTWPRPDPDLTALLPLAGFSLKRELYALLPPQRERKTGQRLLSALTAYFRELANPKTSAWPPAADTP